MSLRGRRHGGGRKNELVFLTTCGPDNQFTAPRQINWSAALGKLLVAAVNATVHLYVRGADLSYHSKNYKSGYSQGFVDSDATHLYHGGSAVVSKFLLSDPLGTIVSARGVSSIRMIDFSSDPDYGYITSSSATDGHGVRKVRKSDMTVVASLLATGSGDGQFNNPRGVKKYGDYVYVCDVTNARIVKLNASDLSFAANISVSTSLSDIATDGVNWYAISAWNLIKYDMSFIDATKVSVDCVGYSLCIIPDQGDGNGQTLAIADNTNSHLARYKCSDLSQVGSDVGSAGDGSASLFDPIITGVAGTWTMDDGSVFQVASGADISWNGFSGYTFRTEGPHRAVFRPESGGLAAITAIDFNDDKITGEIKNLYKCINLTSCKLQTNPDLVLDLGRLSYKLQTIWGYACRSGIFGSIRHMLSATSINFRENGASQSQVDSWIADLYANKDVMAPGTANFNGSNSAPSAAAKAQADELISDYSWTIAYTP